MGYFPVDFSIANDPTTIPTNQVGNFQRSTTPPLARYVYNNILYSIINSINRINRRQGTINIKYNTSVYIV